MVFCFVFCACTWISYRTCGVCTFVRHGLQSTAVRRSAGGVPHGCGSGGYCHVHGSVKRSFYRHPVCPYLPTTTGAVFPRVKLIPFYTRFLTTLRLSDWSTDTDKSVSIPFSHALRGLSRSPVWTERSIAFVLWLQRYSTEKRLPYTAQPRSRGSVSYTVFYSASQTPLRASRSLFKGFQPSYVYPLTPLQ